MGKLRIYELAKELGVENKVIIAKAAEIGLSGKTSHSNSLDPDEAVLLRRALIREAIGVSPDSEVVKTRVDKLTGEESTVVERRKGNIIRRRKRKEEAEEPESAAADEVQEVQEDLLDEISEPVLEAVEDVPEEIQEAVASETEEIQEGEAAAVSAEEVVEGDLSVAGEGEVEEEVVEEAKKSIGPKVLGKIDLPQPQKAKPARGKGRTASEAFAFVEDEEDEDERKDGRRKGRKKKTKKREFSRGDLVDYEGRPGKRAARKGGKGAARLKEEELIVESAEPKDTRPKAAKRVIKMSDEVITVGELAKQMSLKAGEVISKLIEFGVMATINQAIDHDTATIVADDFGYTIEVTGFHEEDILQDDSMEDAEKLISRPPVVTVMGHVDHGKTSLLDYIRNSSVVSKEFGGITQHVGAYSVTVEGDRTISFIDTPGHEAFTAMRARGAEITDIVILVVAGDDGVMPQTVEAVNHSKAAGVSIVVAVNKMDKPGSNPDRVKQQLSELGLQPEEWGGDTLFFPVSALTGDGIKELLEGVLLVAELKELKANPDCRVKGTVIEARQEIGRGTVATVLVQAGTLKVGDIFVAGAEYGRVRSMVDYRGSKIEEAPPSTPVEITGLNGIPLAGDDFVVVESESQSRQVASNRKERQKVKEQLAIAGGPISLEEFSKQAGVEQAQELNIILKADVHGSLEAVRQSIENLSREKIKVLVLHSGVGGVNESDIQLAIASKAIIVGFNVRGEPRALAEADSAGVEVRFYRIIYELIDDVKNAMAGMLEPIREEVQLGRAEVRDIFSVPKIGTVAGCYVVDGTIKRGSLLRLLRDSKVVHEGRMLNLRRFKDDVKEVQNGYECGISIDSYNDIQLGDVIEAFEIKETAATLD
jgi:translation initiation factor IF-2